MIDADGWFDWAIRLPGYPGAVNGGRNGGKGIIPHSAEGHFPTLEYLNNFHLARNTAPPGSRASWGATNLQDGRFVQHFSVWAQTWTSGSPYANNNYFAFEHEGLAGEALTPPQVANLVRVGRELMALQGWTARRPVTDEDLGASCYEHNECTRFGSAATACPSGRIPWGIIIPTLNHQEDEPMTAEEKLEFEKLQKTVKDLQTIAWDQGLRLNVADIHVHQVTPAAPALTGAPKAP